MLQRQSMRAFILWPVVCSLLAGGCSTFSFAPPEPVIYSQAGAYTEAKFAADLAKYESTASEVRKELRDKMIFSTAAEIDQAYAAFKNSFFGERAATETTLDIALIGLGSAGALAGGATTKAILAAIATGVTASRLSFNKNFFKEKTPDLLLTRMDALRAEQWAITYGKLTKASDQEYSWWEAERDLVAYYQAGTLEAAFQNIIIESGAGAKKAQDQIQREIAQKFGPEAGEIDRTDSTKEVMALYKEWRALKDMEREARATQIVEAFKGRMPEYKVPVIAKTSSDQLATIYVCAIQKSVTPACAPATVREALVASFKEKAKEV